MRYALILAGGSGTRLWPMSTKSLPKQLIPFIDGKSLLEIAYDRLESLVPAKQRYICAGDSHRAAVVDGLAGFTESQFIGEPVGRDTLSALALSAAAISRDDADAIIAVFTADHIIEPVEDFQRIVDQAFSIVEDSSNTLMTFGINPTHAATGYGYLELSGEYQAGSSVVRRFKEKPDGETAAAYLAAGPERYLWNSGMFVWKASVFLDCVRRYEPEIHAGIERISAFLGADGAASAIAEVYPTLKKTSVDFAVMEPASSDSGVTVAALPMPLSWLDVGSWTQFAETLTADPAGNTASGGKAHFLESKRVLAVSEDPDHLISTIGCEDLIIIHTKKATLVCPKNQAEKIKALHGEIGDEFGEDYL
ncbi:MAG: mannose-1-phosphate guanylyltransferase [Spirochaetales bacterium]|jgi:mannose-1-phosphate guanylyltransferase|nr:mannose-1-phosphate guanylyltransferase [Spirochaetales bacterium]